MRALAGLLLLVLVGCGQAEPSSPQARHEANASPEGAAAQRWSRLEDSPLSARHGVVAAFVDGRAVFVGGYRGPPCPPTADCVAPPTYAADGAAYDLARRSWEPIASAPVPIPDSAPHAVIGTHLFVRVGGSILDYAAARDRWSTVEVPTGTPEWQSLVPDGARLVLPAGSDEQGEQPDRVLDTRTGKWSTLPDDPFELSFDRSITATPAGLVLTSKEIDSEGNPADPALLRAALLPPGSDRWTRLPDSDQLGGARWVWTGKSMVDPSLGGADGGEVNGYGRTIRTAAGSTQSPARGHAFPTPRRSQPEDGPWRRPRVQSSPRRVGCTTTQRARGTDFRGRRAHRPSQARPSGRATRCSSSAARTGAKSRSLRK